MNSIDRKRYIWVAVSALLQGLLLGIFAIIRTGPLTCIPLTVIFLVPFTFWLSQEHWGRRLWNFLIGLTLILLVFWLYRLWSLYSPEGSFYVVPSHKSDLIRVSMAVFLLIPFFQCRIASWSWRIPYADIFFQLCRNLFLLFQASIVIAVFWGLLVTAGLLFDIVGLSGVPLVLFNPLTAVPLSAMIIAISISVAIKHPGIDSLGRWLLSVLAWLLPFFSVLSVMFLVCLPFLGLDALFSTGQASTLMLLLQFGTIILANAAYLDGAKSAFRTKWIDSLAKISLLCLPVYTVLCLYSLGLRITQYGLTTDRVQAVFLAVVTGIWGLGYAFAVVLRKWPGSIGKVNIASVVFMAVIVAAMNSPLLDPSRLSAANQTSRLISGRTDPDSFDYLYMRFSLGRWGVNALHKLATPQALEALATDPEEYSRYVSSGIPSMKARMNTLEHARVVPEDRVIPEGTYRGLASLWPGILSGSVDPEDISLVFPGGEYMMLFTESAGVLFRLSGDLPVRAGVITGDFRSPDLGSVKAIEPAIPDIEVDGEVYRVQAQ